MRPEAAASAAVLILVLGGCGRAAPPGAPVTTPAPVAPDIAARHNVGEISLAAVEKAVATALTPACVQARSAPGGGGLESLVDCYREVAEALALEGVVLADLGDVDGALGERDEQFGPQRDGAVLEAYYRQLRDRTEVTEEEITARFDERRAELAVPRRFTLYNIFRRHRDPADPAATMAFLRDLKARIEAGETFRAIAREHSDSETRLRDGLVGHLAESDLPAPLREQVARLEPTQVSDPLPVRGGAVLLAIENVTPAVEPDLERARVGILGQLLEEKLNAAVDARTAGRSTPEGAIVLSDESLIERLDDSDPEQPVFDLGGQRLTVAEFRRSIGLRTAAAGLSAEERERVTEIYAQLRRRRLLLLDLVESNRPEDQALIEEVENRLRQDRLTGLVDELIEQEVERSVDENPVALERFFDDNAHHYLSPLRFKLKVWHLPLDRDPAAQLAAMERARDRLQHGEEDLASAAARLGGAINDLGWRAFDELDEFPGKARDYLIQAPPGGYSIPYQQEDALHLAWVEDLEVPVPLEYDDVRERVREDYLQRFEQILFREAVDRRLTAAGFTFFSDHVRRHLAPPEPAGSATLAVDSR